MMGQVDSVIGIRRGRTHQRDPIRLEVTGLPEPLRRVSFDPDMHENRHRRLVARDA